MTGVDVVITGAGCAGLEATDHIGGSVRTTAIVFGLRPFDDRLMERHARHDVFFLAYPFDTDLIVGFVGCDLAWEIEAAGVSAAVDCMADRLVDLDGACARMPAECGPIRRGPHLICG